MTTTVFADDVTPIVASWLNDVDKLVYDSDLLATTLLRGDGLGGLAAPTIGNGLTYAVTTLSVTGLPAATVELLTSTGAGGMAGVTIGAGLSYNTTTKTLSNSGTIGGVTAVTATAPVASSGGTTPVISMAAATTSVDGYLTSTDWNTFNGKQPAGTYATGTGTANGTNTGDNAVNTLYSGLVTFPGFGTTGTTACVGNDARLSDARPASDVYAWAKAAVKPSYTYTEVGADPAGAAAAITLAGLGGQPALSGTGFVKISGTTISYDNSTYVTGTPWTSLGYITLTSLSAGTGISYNNTTGVITNDNPTPYSLPTASTTVLGGVKVDGTSITIAAGVISATTGGSGTVTSVGTTSPLTGGTITGSGTIGIQVANTSQGGYLSSTDWNTFNSKQPAGAYLTSISGQDLSTANNTTSAFTTLAAVAGVGYVTGTPWTSLGYITLTSLSAGTGISYNNTTGVITNDNPTPYSLPTASTTVLGGVKVDGTSITIAAGVISATTGGGGTVTSIATTSPITGGTITGTGTIGIQVANTGQAGYLSATDWNTFNSKQPAGSYLTTAVTSATAGTGMSVSASTGAVTFTNTAPDQTVSLTASTGISVSGTYPSFTITNSAPATAHPVQVVTSISALGSASTTITKCIVTGYYAEGDGGGGTYYYSASAATANGGSIIAASGGGYWRLTQVEPWSIRQFGAKGDYTFGGSSSGTNDTTAIQAAIDAVNALGGGTLLVPKGIYGVTTLNLKSYVTLLGATRSTSVIFQIGNTNAHLLSGNGVSYITLQNLTLDGNSSSEGNTPSNTYTTASLWLYANCTDIQLLSCEFRYAYTASIGFVKGARMVIQDCSVHHATTGFGIAIGYYQGSGDLVTDVAISNCQVFECGSHGIVMGKVGSGAVSARRVSVTGNNLYHNGLGAAGGGGVWTADGVVEVTITGNTCAENQGDQIGIQYSKNVTITGNTCYLAGGPEGDATNAGIAISHGCQAITASGNVCYRNAGAGIIISGFSDGVGTDNNYDITLIGNVCYNNGVVDNTFAGIYVRKISGSYSGQGLTIVGNSCYDDQGTHTQGYGIYLDSVVASARVSNNILHSNKTADMYNDSTAANLNVVTSNLGYNPVGSVTAPAVPASTVNQNNTYSFPIRVYVSGGTVTGITTGGVATGLIAGSFSLQPNEGISITYSAAPTWVWSGE